MLHGCISKDGRKKHEEQMMQKVANKQRKQDLQSRMKKQDPFQFVSISFWCSRCFTILFIPLLSTKHDHLSFL